MNLSKILYVFLLFIIFSCNQGRIPKKMEISLIKDLQLRCQYDFNFDSNSLTVECIKEDTDTCRITHIVSRDNFMNLAKGVNKLKNRIYEFEGVDDGGFFEVNIDWGDTTQVLVIENFPIHDFLEYTHEFPELSKVSEEINKLYNDIDSNKCW